MDLLTASPTRRRSAAVRLAVATPTSEEAASADAFRRRMQVLARHRSDPTAVRVRARRVIRRARQVAGELGVDTAAVAVLLRDGRLAGLGAADVNAYRTSARH